MKGTVKIANNTKGVFFIEGDDGKTYFAHESKIRQSQGLRFLMAGWKVEFVPKEVEGKWQAMNVAPLSETGVTRATPDQRGFCESQEFIPIHLDVLGRMRVGTDILTPTVTAKTEQGAFRAYYVGGNRFRGFDLGLPASTNGCAFVVLDRNKKAQTEDKIPDAKLGSYLVKVESNGKVVIWNLGVRIQNGTAHYVLLERRFMSQYDFSDPSEESLLAQTPTSGLDRDNNGFVPGILEGIQRMKSASVEVAA